jgi:hypothetical protein
MPEPMKTLARGLAPLLGALAIAVFAAGGPAGDGAAEGLFLARLAAGLLAATSFVAPRALDGALASILAVAAAWVLPAGPPRAVTVVALLAGALTLAIWRRLRADGGALGLARVAVPCAIGLQFLLRSDLLLGAPSPSVAFTLLVLPLVGGASAAWLAARHGVRAGIAAAAILCVGPGWNLTTTVALLALAAAGFLTRPKALATPSALPATAARILAALVILTPIAVNWRAGALTLTAAATLVLDRKRGVRDDEQPNSAWAVLPALVLLALQLVPQVRSHAPANALFLLPLLPAAILAALSGSFLALAATGLALAGASTLGGTAALAPAVGLAALARFAAPERERLASAAQGTWSAALLAATALAAAYPWLRPEPLRTALAALGLDLDPAAWPWLALPAALLALGLVLGVRRPGLLAVWSAAAAVLALAALALRGAERRLPLTQAEIVLDEQLNAQALALPVGDVLGRALVVDSAVLDGAELAAGTPVADLVIERAGGAADHVVLRVGNDTAEWAARRDDLRAAGLAPAPPAWISWVAGTTPPIFGQRYRARFVLAGHDALRSVTVHRAPTLPAATRVVIYGMEIAE